MPLFRRLALVAVTGALAAGAAAAPAGADTTGFCPFVGSQLQPDGSTLVAQEVGSAGCVIVRELPDGTITLDQVIVAPGYTDEIKSAGGAQDNNKVEVRFENPTTKDKAEFLFEPGKTEIK